MTTSDPQQILDQIKARAEECTACEPCSTASAQQVDASRLTEALELLLNLAEELDELARRRERNLPNFGSDNRAKAEAFRESAGAIRRIIEAKLSEGEQEAADHPFLPVAGHPDDDECTHRDDGTDDTYCGLPESDHEWSER